MPKRLLLAFRVIVGILCLGLLVVGIAQMFSIQLPAFLNGWTSVVLRMEGQTEWDPITILNVLIVGLVGVAATLKFLATGLGRFMQRLFVWIIRGDWHARVKVENTQPLVRWLAVPIIAFVVCAGTLRS